MPFLEDLASEERKEFWGPAVSSMHGGEQHRSRRVEMSVTTGHVSRLLDTTNEEELVVRGMLRRLVIELREVGSILERVIRNSFAKVRRLALCNIQDALDVLKWSRMRRVVWKATYDGCEALTRVWETIGMLDSQLEARRHV